MRALTQQQVEGRKEKAVRFVRDVLGDPDRADEIENESVEDYANRRNIQILANPSGGSMSRVRLVNPPRVSNLQRRTMQTNPESGRTELLARIRQLSEENDKLQDKLDKIASLASAPEDGRNEGPDELMDALNSILDVAAPAEGIDEDDNEGND